MVHFKALKFTSEMATVAIDLLIIAALAIISGYFWSLWVPGGNGPAMALFAFAILTHNFLAGITVVGSKLNEDVGILILEFGLQFTAVLLSTLAAGVIVTVAGSWVTQLSIGQLAIAIWIVGTFVHWWNSQPREVSLVGLGIDATILVIVSGLVGFAISFLTGWDWRFGASCLFVFSVYGLYHGAPNGDVRSDVGMMIGMGIIEVLILIISTIIAFVIWTAGSVALWIGSTVASQAALSIHLGGMIFGCWIVINLLLGLIDRMWPVPYEKGFRELVSPS